MPAAVPVPVHLLRRPFSRAEALELGVSERVLEGRRFRRLLPSVYVHRDHEPTPADWRRAGMLWRPTGAVLSHVSVLHDLGIEAGPALPVHLTVATDLHLDVPEVFLHRTRRMPANDGTRADVPAALVGAASMLAPLETVALVEDVLARGMTSTVALDETVASEPWRAGARELDAVLRWVRPGAESRRETILRVVVVAAGLPEPSINVEIRRLGRFVARVDLLVEEFCLVLEYDGRQHLEDARQWSRDIVREQALRDAGYEVLRVTNEMLASPRALVLRVHEALRRRGYRGPAPDLGPAWWRLVSRPEVTLDRPGRGRSGASARTRGA